MIKLIVGLGNPGRQYEKTRHNAGFLFLDHFASALGVDWLQDRRFHGHLAVTSLGGNKLFLLKPQTYMNKSGLAVGEMVRFHKLAVDELMVVHDELDFGVGVVKLKQGGGHAGHNGLRDIIAHVGGNGFARIRFGIGRPLVGSVADYVLSDFDRDGFAKFQGLFPEIEGVVGKIIQGQLQIENKSLT